MPEHEIWKDIPGYEGSYQASSLGRIRSVDRCITQKSRYGLPVTRKLKGRVLRPSGSKKDPHLFVALGHGKNGSTVHSLVAATFLGPCPPGCEVRHLDGDPLNNRIDNLAYGNRSENILDVYRVGKRWRKLSLPEIQNIFRRSREGEPCKALAAEYNVSENTVYKIRKGDYKSCQVV